MRKANRTVKCHGHCCRAIISVGTLCLKVKGSLSVPLNRNDAVKQDFYFCPQKFFVSSMPIWSNVRYPNSVDADAGVADSDKDNSYINFLHFITSKFPFFKECLCSYIFAASFVESLFIENIFVDFNKVVSG